MILPTKRYDDSYYTNYYTLLHAITQKVRNIDTLAGEVLEPGDRKFNSKHPLRGHAAVIDPVDDI